MAYVNGLATLGRGGFGAVMGAKNLKAIVVQGTGSVKVADRKRYRALKENLLQRMRDYRFLKEAQDLAMFRFFPDVPIEIYRKIKKRRMACVSCPIGCKDMVQIQDGKFKGLVACSASAINLFTPVIYGFKDYWESVKLINLLDSYGLDMFEFFGIMGLAKALCDQGIISPGDIETPVELQSFGSMYAWAKKIAFREGLGNVFADGFDGIFSAFGEQAKRHAPALVKGLHPYAGPGAAVPWELFGTMELGQALEPRGPHVGSGGSPTYSERRPLEVFPGHIDRMGAPQEAVARILPGLNTSGEKPQLKVGRLLKYSHNWFTLMGSLGICLRAQINRFYSASLCADLYEAVTGIETDLGILREKIDRVWTLLRMANVREGFTRKDDVLPEIWFKEAGFKHYLEDKPMTLPEAEEMIVDYYDEQGWDKQTGIPTKSRLKALGLDECL